jgi:hypothetical protein
VDEERPELGNREAKKSEEQKRFIEISNLGTPAPLEIRFRFLGLISVDVHTLKPNTMPMLFA